MNHIAGEEALSVAKPGNRLLVQGGAATLHLLLDQSAEPASTLWNVKVVGISLQGNAVIEHTHYIVTEYGIAYLYGWNMRQRAKALIDIAHPNHRERLEREAFERFHTYEFERTLY
jgi:hypothetical protein